MTIHLAEGPTGAGTRRSLARWNLELHRGGPAIRYGFSVVCVAVALGVALACQYYGVRDVELPLFELAIIVITWYAGVGPSVLAVVLSTACFNYFFTEPLYTFAVSREDLPYFFLFAGWAAIIAWFVAVRRRIESDLRDARDHLQAEVEERKRREDEIRKLNNELAKRARDLETSNNELGASGRSPTKRLWIVKQQARVHGRRLALQLGWHGSGRRSVLGCARRGVGGVAERRREGVCVRHYARSTGPRADRHPDQHLRARRAPSRWGSCGRERLRRPELTPF